MVFSYSRKQLNRIPQSEFTDLMPLLPNLLLNDSKSTIDLIMGRKLWGLDQCTKFERGAAA